MNTKKTVAILALTISTSSFALRMPPVETKNVCLSTYEAADGSLLVGNCDETENNEMAGLALSENGCAEGQSSLRANKWRADQEFSPRIQACMPANIIQL